MSTLALQCGDALIMGQWSPKGKLYLCQKSGCFELRAELASTDIPMASLARRGRHLSLTSMHADCLFPDRSRDGRLPVGASFYVGLNQVVRLPDISRSASPFQGRPKKIAALLVILLILISFFGYLRFGRDSQRHSFTKNDASFFNEVITPPNIPVMVKESAAQHWLKAFAAVEVAWGEGKISSLASAIDQLIQDGSGLSGIEIFIDRLRQQRSEWREENSNDAIANRESAEALAKPLFEKAKMLLSLEKCQAALPLLEEIIASIPHPDSSFVTYAAGALRRCKKE